MSTGDLAELVEAGTVSGRLWFYTNYHCNLTCRYCLTGSSPHAPRRVLDPERMLRLAHEARNAGFRALGISGGEPLLNPWLPDVAAKLARVLPLVVLTNGTLFTPRLLARVRPWAELDLEVQISLDSADPDENDALRAPDNFARVVEAIPRLVECGITVRVATTLDRDAGNDLDRLCALHRSLGVDDDHHIVRPVVTRGRARTEGLGIAAGQPELMPELTITAEGAYWSPFGATARPDGEMETDLLVTRTVEPLARPLEALLGLVRARPPGDDQTLDIR